ncbi:hypothetical protein Q9233_013433 [Columba guinea]|nr:hypothetical protein Q9233_013433 [Columba guinea]
MILLLLAVISFEEVAQDLNVIEEVIRMMLEIINSCLTNSLHHNPNLVYALLYKRDLFEQFRTHPSFQDIMQNIDLVISFFSSRLEQAGAELSVERVLEIIKQGAVALPKDRLRSLERLLPYANASEIRGEKSFSRWLDLLLVFKPYLHVDGIFKPYLQVDGMPPGRSHLSFPSQSLKSNEMKISAKRLHRWSPTLHSRAQALVKIESAVIKHEFSADPMKFPELKFKYVEEEQPEEFFIPYVWSLVYNSAVALYWNPHEIQLFTMDSG